MWAWLVYLNMIFLLQDKKFPQLIAEVFRYVFSLELDD